MKLTYKLTSIILSFSLLTSCSTTQKIQISGLAGTEIYTPSKAKVGTISNSGHTEVILESDAYYAYLLSKTEGSDNYIPFALDYKNENYTGEKMARVVGYTLSGIGLGIAIPGTIGLLATGGDDPWGIVSAIGLGTALAGVAIGMPVDSRLQQIDHKYGFKYLSQQTTNQDITFTQPQLITVSPEKEKATKSAKHAVDKTSQKDNSKKSSSSKSSKSFKDYSTAIEGSYIGSGTLMLGERLIESYKDIVIKITRIDNSSVEVSIIESDGLEFFSETSVYNIKKGSGNTFTLTHNDISEATIKIDKNKKAIYIHPRVEIDGDIYTLKITATK